MDAITLNIEDRSGRHMSNISSIKDFSYTVGTSFDAGRIIDDPTINLYCLDDEEKRAIFAVLPEGIDLAREPFYYLSQFEKALYLVALPYADLHQLADSIQLDFSRLILIHNVGRCGSTLLHQALNEVPDVMCLSEPDVISNFIALRHQNQTDVSRLMQSCVRLLFRPALSGATSRYGLKFRNQCVDSMDSYVRAFPQSKHLFMYRNVMDWFASLYRLVVRSGENPSFSRAEAIEQLAIYYNCAPERCESYFDPAIESLSFAPYLAVSWLMMMDRYLELYQHGIISVAVRYEDILLQPEAILGEIFDYCDLPQTETTSALKAFARDSQAGTRLARDQSSEGNSQSLPDELVAEIQATLARHAIIQSADYILPGTISH